LFGIAFTTTTFYKLLENEGSVDLISKTKLLKTALKRQTKKPRSQAGLFSIIPFPELVRAKNLS
jgi:hypothetical protein